VRADVAAEGEDGVEVDLEDGVPVRGGKLMGGVPALDAGAVEEDVDAVAGVEDGGDEGGDRGGGGEVGGVDGGSAAKSFDLGLCFLVCGVPLEEVVSVAVSCSGGGKGKRNTWTSRMSAPASASAIAMACPIPRVPPVTRAVCPWRENIAITPAILMLSCGDGLAICCDTC